MLGEGLSTEARLMITLTAETVGSIIGAVTLAASVLLILGFRRPLIVLPGLESQILLQSDLRPSAGACRRLARPRLCPQDVLCLSQDEDRQWTVGKTESEIPQQQGEGHPGSYCLG